MTGLRFGVFDHLDADGLPLGAFYENRLKLVEAYERAGLYGYHTAEHHATPLGMCPSPSVLHAAIAQRTRTLRFGPLVYTLALYHPLRLAEEICMLDHLSGGRFQLGIGRGISPFELGYFGADPAEAQARYIEAWSVITRAFAGGRLTHEGPHFKFEDVPIQMQPQQRPHPPLWYGLGDPAAIGWCVANRVNVVSNAPLQATRTITDRYREAWAAAGQAPGALPLMGMTRHTVIAPSQAEALDIARRAYRRWYASFMYLWELRGGKPPFAAYPPEIDELLAAGRALVGTPTQVAEAIEAQAGASGISYLLLRFAFGDLSPAESMRSLGLFAAAVRPRLATSPSAPAP